jgi:AraC-like DNA-binding protein
MLFLEAFIKFGTIGLLIAVGLLIARDGRKTRALRFGLPLIVAICFMFMTTGSPELSLSGPIVVPLRLFDCLNFIFIWWLGLAFFDDDFELGKRELAIASVFAALSLYLRLHYLGFDVYYNYALVLMLSGFSFLLMMHLCLKAIVGRKEDLIEQRRRIRIWFVVAVALVAVSSTLAERIASMVGMYEQETIWVTYIFTFPIVAWALLWLARLHPEVIMFDSKQSATKAPIEIDDRDKLAFQKLSDAMQADKAFIKQGFSIGDLAKIVGIPPHQLRKLINQTMGYRNFSSFLNRYRIAEVKKSLSDLDKARIPVLTLAMDAGFSSLAPFNRAFKASEGITPTDFRAQALAESTSNPVQN